jgi:hypothetical protein
MNSFTSIIKADYLQRTRSNIFLATLLVSIYIAYSFVPSASAAYSTVRIGNFVGYSNAAWIGHVTAIMTSTFMWFIGFYIINNGIRRDEESGIGQIIAATSISNFNYLLAKTLSSFIVLLTITFIIILMALGLIIVRGSEYHFNVLQFILPYLYATFPSLFFLSALAVFFEIVFGKRTNLSNASFYFLFAAMVGFIFATDNPLLQWFDVLGTKHLINEIASIVNGGMSGSHQDISVGYNFGSKKELHYFLFEGTHFNLVYFTSRLFWVAMAVVLLWISSRMFRRFDTRTLNLPGLKSQNHIPEIQATKLSEITLSTLPEISSAFNIYPLIKSEIMMLLRKGPLWFWLVNLGMFITLFFIPLGKAHQLGLPILWFFQINRWADIATKEKYYGTSSFVYGSSKPLSRLLTAQIIAGTLTSLAFASPVLLRYAFAGEFIFLPGIVLGAIILIGFSTCLGILTGGKRLFEIFFFMLTYAVVENIPLADYFGGQHFTTGYFAIQMLIVLFLLATSYIARNYEIRNQ